MIVLISAQSEMLCRETHSVSTSAANDCSRPPVFPQRGVNRDHSDINAIDVPKKTPGRLPKSTNEDELSWTCCKWQIANRSQKLYNQ